MMKFKLNTISRVIILPLLITLILSTTITLIYNTKAGKRKVISETELLYNSLTELYKNLKLNLAVTGRVNKYTKELATVENLLKQASNNIERGELAEAKLRLVKAREILIKILREEKDYMSKSLKPIETRLKLSSQIGIQMSVVKYLMKLLQKIRNVNSTLATQLMGNLEEMEKTLKKTSTIVEEGRIKEASKNLELTSKLLKVYNFQISRIFYPKIEVSQLKSYLKTLELSRVKPEVEARIEFLRRVRILRRRASELSVYTPELRPELAAIIRRLKVLEDATYPTINRTVLSLKVEALIMHLNETVNILEKRVKIPKPISIRVRKLLKNAQAALNEKRYMDALLNIYEAYKLLRLLRHLQKEPILRGSYYVAIIKMRGIPCKLLGLRFAVIRKGVKVGTVVVVRILKFEGPPEYGIAKVIVKLVRGECRPGDIIVLEGLMLPKTPIGKILIGLRFTSR